MFNLYNCQDEYINNTLVQHKYCYECNTLCEFGLFIFSFLLIICCIDIYCKKKEFKEIKDDPPSYY